MRSLNSGQSTVIERVAIAYAIDNEMLETEAPVWETSIILFSYLALKYIYLCNMVTVASLAPKFIANILSLH